MGVIKDNFLNYAKWGATKFTDLFSFPIVNFEKDDGLKWHLQEIRQKTADAIASLEAADNSIVSANSSVASNKFQIVPLTGYENGFISNMTGFGFGWDSDPTLTLIAEYNGNTYITILTEVK